MAWARLDDGFWRNPKVLSVSPGARWAYVAMISWSVDNLTDGFVPDACLVQIVASRSARNWAETCIRAGLLSRGVSRSDKGYHIHDFHEYNPTAEQVKERRDAWRERQGRARKPATNMQTVSRRDSASPVPVPVVYTSVSPTAESRPRGTNGYDGDQGGLDPDEVLRTASRRITGE